MGAKGKSGMAAVRVIAVLMMIIVPILLTVSVAHVLFTSADFYLEMLKGSYLIRAFVEGKNDETNRRIRQEIEEKVRLDEFAIVAQRAKEKYEKEKERYEKIHKTKEYLAHEKQLKEIRKSTYEEAKQSFPNEKAFEEFREKEIARLRKSLSDIESYRDKNENEIERVEEEMDKARRNMERAMEELQEKNEEAQEIVEKHKGTFAARINDDMRLLLPVLEPMLNEKIIDGTVRREVETMLAFVTDYSRQKMLGNVYSAKNADSGNEELRIRLPRVTLSLWIDDPQKGKRHLLSDVFVEEIGKIEGLRNKFLFTTVFRLSDTVIAEYLANRFLKSAGVTIREGIISVPPVVLEGKTAESFKHAMLFATYGHYVKYGAGALLVLFIVFLIFLNIPRMKKIIWLKRVLFWPSLVMVIFSIGLIIASRFVFEMFPYIFPDAMLVGFVKNIAYSLAWCIAIPTGGVFLVCAAIGFFIGAVKTFFTEKN